MKHDVDVRFCDETLAGKLRPLRIRLVAYQILCAALFVFFLVLSLIIWISFMGNDGRAVGTNLNIPFYVPLAALALCALCFILAKRCYKKMKRLITNNIVDDMLAESFEMIAHMPGKYISQQTLDTALLRGWWDSRGNDFLQAKRGGAHFTFSDVELTMQRSKRLNSTIFKGQWLILERGKEIVSSVVITEIEVEDLPQKYGSFEARLPKIWTGNAEFGKRFIVRGKDPDTAFSILTPDFMEFLLSLRKQTGHNMHFCFVGKHLHIGINTNQDFFELDKGTPDIPKLREKIQEEINRIKEIIDQFSQHRWLFEPGEETNEGRDTNVKHNEYVEAAIKCGAVAAAVVPVEKIAFDRGFRAACEQNICGKYGRNWTCPPDCGDIDEMIAHAKTYTHALVFQSIGQLEDSYDIDGMRAAAQNHSKLVDALARDVQPLLEKSLRLGAGGCHVCDRCAKMHSAPCRLPDRATVSLEAYGVGVSELAALAGLNYMNGVNTVTYFGGIFF